MYALLFFIVSFGIFSVFYGSKKTLTEKQYQYLRSTSEASDLFYVKQLKNGYEEARLASGYNEGGQASPFATPREIWKDLDLSLPVCNHTHPLIIQAGHGRTGSVSLANALRSIGISVAHYEELTTGLLKPPYANELDNYNWCRFDNIGAVMDMPIPFFVEEILSSYPASRVILNVREPRAWLNSMYTKTMLTNSKCGNKGVDTLLDRMMKFRSSRVQLQFLGRFLSFGTPCPSNRTLLKSYVNHHRLILNTVPREKLLILFAEDPENMLKILKFLGRDVKNEKNSKNILEYPHLHIANVHTVHKRSE